MHKARPLWLAAWPFWSLLIFASLAAVRLLPGGYARAAVATPILLLVPGSLTLGAVFSQRSRPRGVGFVCYAALLSAIWSAFASLALYLFNVLITAGSTYWCLFIVSAVLAIAAETRILLGRPGRGRRATRKLQTPDSDLFDAESQDAAVRSAGYYAIVAVVAGMGLLVGGLYAYHHLSHPAPTGYTWVAWTGPQIKGDIAIGPAGTKLGFQIVHRQPDATTFRLSARWLGTPSRPLAKPVTLIIGPNRTYRGALFVPPLPDGCVYRIVVTLAAAQQLDPSAKKPRSWSINADVRDPNKSAKTCKG
jgi:hypothetical protein